MDRWGMPHTRRRAMLQLVFQQHLGQLDPDGDKPLFLSFAHDAEIALVQVDVAELESRQLRDANPVSISVNMRAKSRNPRSVCLSGCDSNLSTSL